MRLRCQPTNVFISIGSPNLAHKCSTMSPGNRFIWGHKVKGQDHKSQQNCVGLQTERNIAAGFILSHVGFSLLQCAAAQAMPAIPGFPCVISARPMLLPRDINHARQTDRRFFPAGSFSQSASGKKIAGVGHDTLVSAGVFQFYL